MFNNLWRLSQSLSLCPKLVFPQVMLKIYWESTLLLFILFILKYGFIYLAVSGLSCGMQDLWNPTWAPCIGSVES